MFIRTVNNYDNYYNILNNDSELVELLNSKNLTILDNNQRYFKYSKMIKVLLQDTEVDLLYFKKFIQDEVFGPISLYDIDEVVNQIIYSFKYASINNFFRDNWERFVPEFDKQLIIDNDKLKLLHKSFMSEFDYFAQLISEISIINDIDRVPSVYLDYIGQLLGYERDDNEKKYLTDDFFRIFLKNIIDIYNRKGTNFCIELFFNFIGYDVVVEEFWFDKRFNDPAIDKNPFTNSTDKYDYLFYLTKRDPRNGYNVGALNMPKVAEKMFATSCPSLPLFNYKLIGNPSTNPNITKISLSNLLDEYTYFKTNFINLKLKVFRSNLPTKELTMSAEDKNVIDDYVKFIAPIFVLKKYETVVEEGDPEIAFVSISDFNENGIDGWTNKDLAGFVEKWYEILKSPVDYYGLGYMITPKMDDKFTMFDNAYQIITFRQLNSFKYTFSTWFSNIYYKDNIGENIIIKQDL